MYRFYVILRLRPCAYNFYGVIGAPGLFSSDIQRNSTHSQPCPLQLRPGHVNYKYANSPHYTLYPAHNRSITRAPAATKRSQRLFYTPREVECSICEEPFSDTHAPVITNCDHIFGMHCLEAWARSNNRGHNRCANCRGVIFDDDLPLIEDEGGVGNAAKTFGMAGRPAAGGGPAARARARADATLAAQRALAGADGPAGQPAAGAVRRPIAVGTRADPAAELAALHRVAVMLDRAPPARYGVPRRAVYMLPNDPADQNRDER
jgi:hypothetical protein